MQRIRRSIIVVALAALAALPLCGLAQEDWKKKPYQQWTKDDIIAVSSNSPWAYVLQASAGIGNDTAGAYLPAVTIRLRSALPIRRALVRLKQIEAKYDNMNDQQRAEFDAKAQGLLNCPACADNYAVTLGPPVSTRQVKNAIGSLLDVNIGMLEKKVYLLNDRGERRELVHFIAPKHADDEATFFFSRVDDKGQPLLRADSKKLIVIFDIANLRTRHGLSQIPERFEFDVAKLIVNGKVDF